MVTSANNETMQILLDKHSPVVTKEFTIRPNTKWYNTNIRKAKVIRRRLERKKNKSNLQSDIGAGRAQAKLVNYLISEAKTDFNKTEVLKSKSDIKQLFHTCKRILNWVPDTEYPRDVPLQQLPENFSNFFYDKVVKINDSISDALAKEAIEDLSDSSRDCPTLSDFRPATEKEITRAISDSSLASCELDPLPTQLVKNSPAIIPWFTQIVNLSLQSGTVPQDMKHAIIRPLIKNNSLDSNILKNFRPVSNLSFLSKLTERVVANRITDHVTINDLAEHSQSAYRRFHSTETAVLKIKNDIMNALNKRKITALILLDLSAAFDTIHHEKLLDRLSGYYGVTGIALSWIRSYLASRTQSVKLDGYESKTRPLNTGVPQGSVLGPLLFTLYTATLSGLIRSHGLNSHSYADDSQLYLSFDTQDIESELQRIEKCLKDVRKWMLVNFLKLNDDKTEFLIFSSKHSFNKIDKNVCKLKIGQSDIECAESARNLGVIFDRFMTMERFVNAKCKSALYSLRSISKIRRYLDTDTTRTLVQALVISRLDYSNSVLYGINISLLKKLQRVQNCAARVISKTKRKEHITPILFSLHWLPISMRIRFKTLMLCFKCLNGLGPKYLSDLLEPYTPGRTLRNRHNTLRTKRSANKSGDQCFAIYGPMVWNSLPERLRAINSLNVFRTSIKTYLFKQYYD